MFEVGVVGHFEARHHLVGDFGPASQPHGHSYRIEAVVRGARLKPDGTLLDISLLQNALAQLTDSLNGRDLNAAPGLAEPNPTAEVLARAAHKQLSLALADTGVSTLEVRVWESAEAFAAYAADLGR